jgi:hypothetical protein
LSRGPGKIQNYLMDLLLDYSPSPMTFAEIMTIAYPEGSFESGKSPRRLEDRSGSFSAPGAETPLRYR